MEYPHVCFMKTPSSTNPNRELIKTNTNQTIKKKIPTPLSSILQKRNKQYQKITCMSQLISFAESWESFMWVATATDKFISDHMKPACFGLQTFMMVSCSETLLTLTYTWRGIQYHHRGEQMLKAAYVFWVWRLHMKPFAKPGVKCWLLSI